MQKEETKKKLWWRHSIEILLIILIVYCIKLWQEKDLLSASKNDQAPFQTLVGLDSKVYSIPIKNSKQIIYFFAPWCTFCDLSIGNIESQKQALLDKGYQVRYVALDWKSQQEVETFANDNKLTFPVLMGDIETTRNYQITGFPTYYLIDEQGAIIANSKGYSTSLGIWLRSLNN